MNLDAVLLISRDNIYSQKAIDCFRRSEVVNGIKKSISIPAELYEIMSSRLPKNNVKIIIQKKRSSSLFEHMKLLTSYLESQYIIFLHDDDLIHESFLTRVWEIVQNKKPKALASRGIFIGENDNRYKNRQYKPKNKLAKLSFKKILMKYFSPIERSVLFPTLVYDRNLLMEYWKAHKFGLGNGEDVRIVSYFASTGGLLENQDSRFFKYRMYDGQGCSFTKGYDRLIIIAWLKKQKLNFYFKNLYIFLAKLQYIIYTKTNFKTNNIFVKFLIKYRPLLVSIRKGGKEKI